MGKCSNSTKKSPEAAPAPSHHSRGLLLAQFCDYTTAHGLGRFSSQRTAFGRIIWFAFLIGTYSGFGYHLYTLFERFYSIPLLTTFTTSLAYEFPDVYICPTDTVSISRWMDDSDAQRLMGMLNCDSKCRQRILGFNIMNNDFGFSKPSKLSNPALALSDVMAGVENGLTQDFRFIMQSSPNAEKTPPECRYTGSGEEYRALANTAFIYSDSTLAMYLTSASDVNQPSIIKPYITQKACLPWLEAAQRLKSQAHRWKEATTLANKILALNYQHNLCRHPNGIHQYDFNDLAIRPLLEYKGCYPENTTNNTQSGFNYNCLGLPSRALNVEVCQECCYNRNFTYMSLRGVHCFCSSEFNATKQDTIIAKESTMCSMPCPGNISQMCGAMGSVEYNSVYQVREKAQKPIFIPFRREAVRFFNGPYCFYEPEEPDFQLGLGYCNIPYCALTKKYDCSISDTGDNSADGLHFSHYTGRVSKTLDARHCLSWVNVKRNIETKDWTPSPWKSWNLKSSSNNWFMSNLAFKSTSAPQPSHTVLNVYIETPDYSYSSNDNFCRSAAVTIETLYTLANGSMMFSRESYIDSDVPGCFTKRKKTLAFEACEIDSCYNTVSSVTAIIRDSIGGAHLSRQFTSDLASSMSKCSFGDENCNASNFVTVVHPDLGICHRFNKTPFVTSDKGALSELKIKYFTDRMDLVGHELPNANKIASAIRDFGRQAETRSALKVIIAPDGTFPLGKDAVAIYPGQHVELKLRLDRMHSYAVEKRPCSMIKDSVTYRMESWSPIQQDNNSSVLEGLFSATQWSKKIALFRDSLTNISEYRGPMQMTMHFPNATRYDCINDYKVRKFIENCHCLPSILPIQEKYFANYTYCFNQTDANALYHTESCFKIQVSKLNKYDLEAQVECKPKCEISSYSVRESSHPWPNLKRESAVIFLKQLAERHGYPENLTPLRGHSVIYYMYVRAAELAAMPDSGKTKDELIEFGRQLEALQDQLVSVSIEARQPFGEENTEDQAYPTKNLLADLGGALGLWSGVSVLTVCELIELWLYLLAVGKCDSVQPPGLDEAVEAETPLRAVEASSAIGGARVMSSDGEISVTESTCNV